MSLDQNTAISKILNGAADLIEEEGLVKGSFHISNGGWCIDGAIRRVGEEFDEEGKFLPMSDNVKRSLDRVVNYLGLDFNLWRWNDELELTKEQVVKALREAAKEQ